jgi:hypothetical protein
MLFRHQFDSPPRLTDLEEFRKKCVNIFVADNGPDLRVVFCSHEECYLLKLKLQRSANSGS